MSEVPGDASTTLSSLLSGWVPAVLYGMNILITGSCLQILSLRGLRHRVHRILFGVAIVQFVLASLHIAACLGRSIDGFIIHAENPTAFFSNKAAPVYVAEIAIYITNSIVGDAILIWRTYVVWDKNIWLCAPLVLMLIGNAVCGYSMIGHLLTADTSNLLFLRSMEVWSLSAWSLSIAVQLSASGLIAWKIWILMSSEPKSADRGIVPMSVIWVIIESGAIYTSVSLLLVIWYALHMTIGAIAVSALGQLATLIPTSIVVRVGLSQAIQLKLRSTSMSEDRTFSASTGLSNVIIDSVAVFNDTAKESPGYQDIELYGLSRGDSGSKISAVEGDV